MMTARFLKTLLFTLMIAVLGGVMLTAQAQDETPERPLLMAHYMPWYQTPDVSGYWGWHWKMDHFDPSKTVDGRQQIASQFMPQIGPYDSQDKTVLEYQVLLMKLSGIDGVIVDWYGTEDWRDYAVNNAATLKLFEATKRAGLKFVLCYEDQTVLHMIEEDYIKREDAKARGAEDMLFAAETFFNDESYVTYNDQPLLFVFGPQYFRQPADWEVMFEGLSPTPALVVLDKHLSWALSSYPWPPMSMSGGLTLNPKVLQSYLDLFYRNAKKRDFVVGSAFPAFLDIYEEAGVRSSYGTIDPQDGETLRSTLATALAANPDIIQLVTWNDYGEGTIIEPTEETGTQYLEIVQDTRRDLNEANFTYTADDLDLPFQLFTLRREHEGDAEANARLDEVFTAIVAGDLETARAILGEF